MAHTNTTILSWQVEQRTESSIIGKIFVNCYSGLGDAIVQGPFLLSLAKKFSDIIYYIKNPIIDLYKELGIEPFFKVRVIDPKFRRFVDYNPKFILDFLTERGIYKIINLRRDLSRYQSRYSNIISFLEQNGIQIYDLSKSVSKDLQKSAHFYDLSRSFFLDMGISAPKFFGWLRKEIKNPNWQTKGSNNIGFFLGASEQTKRLSENFWCSLISNLNSELKLFNPLLIFGSSSKEVRLGKNIAKRLHEKGINFDVIENATLFELSEYVANLHLLISTDSFLIHLAESLGVSVFGIYVSTNAQIYGPQHQNSDKIQSSYYLRCKKHNEFGNCDGWDNGCAHATCKRYINLEECVNKISRQLNNKL